MSFAALCAVIARQSLSPGIMGLSISYALQVKKNQWSHRGLSVLVLLRFPMLSLFKNASVIKKFYLKLVTLLCPM